MNINYTTEEELMEQAVKIGGFKTKKETINMTLLEFIKRRKPINLATPNDLVSETMKIGGFKTKKETISMALLEFIISHEQIEIINFLKKLTQQSSQHEYIKIPTQH